MASQPQPLPRQQQTLLELDDITRSEMVSISIGFGQAARGLPGTAVARCGQGPWSATHSYNPSNTFLDESQPDTSMEAPAQTASNTAGPSVQAAVACNSSSGGGGSAGATSLHLAEEPLPGEVQGSDIVAQLQSRAFWAKLVVCLMMYGFDACAAIVFTLAVVGVHDTVLQVVAVVGVALGLFCLNFSLVFVPPTLSVYAKIAASCRHKGDAEPFPQVLQRCDEHGHWLVLLWCLVHKEALRIAEMHAEYVLQNRKQRDDVLQCWQQCTAAFSYLWQAMQRCCSRLPGGAGSTSLLEAREARAQPLDSPMAASSAVATCLDCLGLFSIASLDTETLVGTTLCLALARLLLGLLFIAGLAFGFYYQGTGHGAVRLVRQLWLGYSAVYCTAIGLTCVWSLAHAMFPYKSWVPRMSVRVRALVARTQAAFDSPVVSEYLRTVQRVLADVVEPLNGAWRDQLQLLSLQVLEFGIGSLAGVWAWLGWVEAMPKVNKASEVWQAPAGNNNSCAAADCRGAALGKVFKASVTANVTSLILNGHIMLYVYYLTEWLRIVLLATSAGLAVFLRARANQDPSTSLRVTMAVLSLAVTYIKNVRDKWKLLERAMQQLSYGGALMLLFDAHLRCLGFWPDEVQVISTTLVPLPPLLCCSDMVRSWRHMLEFMEGKGASKLDFQQPEVQLWVFKLQELVRRANKVVMGENTKACFL